MTIQCNTVGHSSSWIIYIHREILSYYRGSIIFVHGIARGVAEKKNQEARSKIGREQRGSVTENQNSFCLF